METLKIGDYVCHKSIGHSGIVTEYHYKLILVKFPEHKRPFYHFPSNFRKISDPCEIHQLKLRLSGNNL